MAWRDRLREAAYTSPSGVRILFLYEDVSVEFDKKTSAFEFPGADGTFIQDLGHSGRRYPLRVIFSGRDYDRAADIFDKALTEKGAGQLEHPMYGVISVIPFGAIIRSDRLKTAANQVIYNITFWETIDIVYPTVTSNPGGQVLGAVDEYNTAASIQFNDSLILGDTTEKIGFKDKYESLLDNATDVLRPIADTQANTGRQFDGIVSSINNGLDVLIQDPLTLGSQTTQMIQSPARAQTSISNRLEAYGNLSQSIIGIDNSVAVPGNDAQNANTFHTNDIYASTYVTGSIISVVNHVFDTKVGAIEAAEDILNQFDEVTTWRDDNYESLSQIDTGGAYQQLQSAVALAAGFLVEISFSLKQERRIQMDHKTTLLNVISEVYASVKDKDINFFIDSNNLTGSEILELPKGREIVYYV